MIGSLTNSLYDRMYFVKNDFAPAFFVFSRQGEQVIAITGQLSVISQMIQ